MATKQTRTSGTKITITSKHGFRIRHGWFDLDGIPAMIIIAIIVAVRISWRILVIADKVTAWLCWRIIGAARVTCRWLTGKVRAFRAFYPL